MEASNYFSISNDSIGFALSSRSTVKRKHEANGVSLNRSITSCPECGSFISANLSFDHAAPSTPSRKKFLTAYNTQSTTSHDQFRAELGEIKKRLSDDCLRSIEDCKAELKSIIDADHGIYRYKENQNILFHVEESDSVNTVKLLFNRIFSSIADLLSITDRNSREKIELILLVCKHFQYTSCIPELEKAISDYDNSGKEFCDSLSDFKKREEYFRKAVPNCLAFDLLLDGHFNLESGLFDILSAIIYKNHLINFPPSKRMFKFEFDNSINIQMIWTLISVMDFWKTGSSYSPNLLDSFVEEVYEHQGIKLREDDDLIKYIAMRIDTNDIKDFICFHRKGSPLMQHIDKINREEMSDCITPPEKLIHILKRFIRSDCIKDFANSLFDYFKMFDNSFSSYFLALLKKKPVITLAKVEEFIDVTDERLHRMSEEYFLSLKKQELSEILTLEKEKAAYNQEVLDLSEKKMNLIAEINALKLGVNKLIAKSITDPITLDIIEDAVITRYGHSFDRKSITRWLEKNETCPITRQRLTLRKIYPNRNLQAIIDDLPQLKADVDSTDTK